MAPQALSILASTNQGYAMFAAQIARSQATKSTVRSTNRLAGGSSTFAPSQSIGNDASGLTAAGSGEHCEAGADREARARRGPPWDFSKIAVLPPDRSSGSQAPSFSGRPMPAIIQRMLPVGAINDPLEHEADHVPDQVVRSRFDFCGIPIHPPATGTREAANTLSPTIVHEGLRSSGEPLEPDARSFMERRFGHDFGHVRVHRDETAAQSADAVNAHAYTVGNDIVFGRGEYAPATARNRSLMAHELTHVVQQRNSSEGSALQRAAKATTSAGDYTADPYDAFTLQGHGDVIPGYGADTKITFKATTAWTRRRSHLSNRW